MLGHVVEETSDYGQRQMTEHRLRVEGPRLDARSRESVAQEDRGSLDVWRHQLARLVEALRRGNLRVQLRHCLQNRNWPTAAIDTVGRIFARRTRLCLAS